MKYTIIITLVLFLGCKNKIEKEAYILPPKFVGKVLIIFNSSNGENIEYNSEGYRIYNISVNGSLKTKFSPNIGFSSFDEDDRIFYYRDSFSLKKNTIKFLFENNGNPIDSNNIIAYGLKTGRYGDFKYLSFYVDSFKNFNKNMNDSLPPILK